MVECQPSRGCRVNIVSGKNNSSRLVFLSEIDVIHLPVCGVHHFSGSCVVIEVRTVLAAPAESILENTLSTHFCFH
jgi:hypothetical protein